MTNSEAEKRTNSVPKSGHLPWQVTPQQCVEVARDFLPIHARILEAGCGSGLSGAALATAGFDNLHGIDISPEMLEIARLKGIYRGLREGNLLGRLPYDNSVFDEAICVAVLTHIEDPSMLLRELSRVVSPNGLILFSQRKDLFESRHMDCLLDALIKDGTLKREHQSDWLPYVTNQEDYVKCGITVGYFVYRNSKPK